MLDLYRDKPAKAGGKLFGLPPDSNCQMQYYRADVFEKAGLKPAETWEDVIENAKELSKDGVKVTGTTMRRGFWAGAAFITDVKAKLLAAVGDARCREWEDFLAQREPEQRVIDPKLAVNRSVRTTY